MANRWCVLCGSEYVEGVVMCADCLVPLEDEQPLSVEAVGEPDEEQLTYEFDELDAGNRYDIDRRLAEDGVAHAWDGTTLVVREADEDRVDALLERTGAADSVGGNQIAYDLGDWDEAKRATLTDGLERARILYDWDDNGDLLVLESDEERVEALLDSVEFPDQLPVDDDAGAGDPGDASGAPGDGLAAQDAMSELFVAADRLMHDPADHEGVLSLVDAARAAESLDVPYGFAPEVWRQLVDQATALRLELEGDADDDAIVDGARQLRQSLRQYV